MTTTVPGELAEGDRHGADQPPDVLGEALAAFSGYGQQPSKP